MNTIKSLEGIIPIRIFFLFLAKVNSAAINTGVHISSDVMTSFSLDIYSGVGTLGQMVAAFLSF
jgi:hypothetical protein